jgi:hypothetical protein
MFDKMIVYEALKRSLAPDSSRKLTPVHQTNLQDSSISLLIHDVFGGEILKTHKKKNWHFYNRIDGVRVDFTGSSIRKLKESDKFEDIPATADETNDYIDQADYSTFFMGFVKAFEETLGLEKFRPGLST